MMDDEKFTEEIKKLVEDINQELEEEGEEKNIMYVYGGNAFQQNDNQGTIKNYNAETMTFNEKE